MPGQLVGEILGKALIEGVCFLTGKLIVHLVSFGRLQTPLDPPKQQRFAMTYFDEGRRHLHHMAVILIGMLFWVAVVVSLVLIF